jgi:hypothetical protein
LVCHVVATLRVQLQDAMQEGKVRYSR